MLLLKDDGSPGENFTAVTFLGVFLLGLLEAEGFAQFGEFSIPRR